MRKIFFTLLALSLSLMCAMAQDSPKKTASVQADAVVREAVKYIGRPYRAGGKGPSSFDCSGYVQYVYRICGVELPSCSSEMAKFGKKVGTNAAKFQKGDIILFGSRNKPDQIGHVGIYMAPGEDAGTFTFIHAATTGGIKVSSSNEPYYAERLLGARRVLPDMTTESAPEQPVLEDSFRIVLHSDGTWAFEDSKGKTFVPDDMDGNILLGSNGYWTIVQDLPAVKK